MPSDPPKSCCSLIAFARAATLYDLRRPTLVNEQVLRLKGSRHALKALTDESFVSLNADHLASTGILTMLALGQVPNDIDLRGGVGLLSEEDETGPDTGPVNSGAKAVEHDMEGSAAPESVLGGNTSDARKDREGAEPELAANPNKGKGKQVDSSAPSPAPSQQQQPVATAKDRDGRFSVMVLTGANSSGKSCLLQQAALAV